MFQAVLDLAKALSKSEVFWITVILFLLITLPIGLLHT